MIVRHHNYFTVPQLFNDSLCTLLVIFLNLPVIAVGAKLSGKRCGRAPQPQVLDAPVGVPDGVGVRVVHGRAGHHQRVVKAIIGPIVEHLALVAPLVLVRVPVKDIVHLGAIAIR
jgi:hypothetical protein